MWGNRWSGELPAEEDTDVATLLQHPAILQGLPSMVTIAVFAGVTEESSSEPECNATLKARITFGAGGVSEFVEIDMGSAISVPANRVTVTARTTRTYRYNDYNATGVTMYASAMMGLGASGRRATNTSIVKLASEAASASRVEIPRFARRLFVSPCVAPSTPESGIPYTTVNYPDPEMLHSIRLVQFNYSNVPLHSCELSQDLVNHGIRICPGASHMYAYSDFYFQAVQCCFELGL
jgi:hypothetical protein